MTSTRRHRTAVVLMSISLVLLLVCESLWLKQVYRSARKDLQDDVDQAFLNSVRDLQDTLVHRLYVAPLLKLAERDSSQVTVQIQTNRDMNIQIGEPESMALEQLDLPMTSDSRVKTVMTFISKDDSATLSSPSPDRTQRGNLSFLIDMVNRRGDSLKLTSELSQRLERQIAQQDLPSSYAVILVNDSVSLPPNMGLLTHRYEDKSNQQQYFALFEGYQTQIWGRIWPEMAFGALLLLSIGAAFWVIYRSLRAQDRLTALRQEFISNITHELKTPITTVNVAIEALRNFHALHDPARTEEYLNISQQELKRLSILVDRVLRMGQFDQQELPLQREAVDLHLLTQEVMAAMKLQLEERGAKVHLTVSGDQFVISGDRMHLTSLLYNLLDNALKYSPEQPVIDVSIDAYPDQVCLTVSDQGIGIPADYQAKVFDPFFRVPKGDTHDVKGHGLGLNYVARVVKAHGGHIDLLSEAGEGSTFRVWVGR